MARRKLRAGRLARHTVEIEALEGERGAYGEPPNTPTRKLTRCADVRPASARERFEAAQVQAEITHVVMMRWDRLLADQLKPSRRLKLDGSRVLEIISVINVDELNQAFEVRAIEKVDG